MATVRTLEPLDALARFEPGDAPVMSLYLNTDVGETGKPRYDVFLRKELSERIESYPRQSSERASLERGAERIGQYLANELAPSTRGVAIFTATDPDLFEALAFAAPFERHELVVARAPHLYPLARLQDQYRRYAALVVDTHVARILVFSGGAAEQATDVRQPVAKRTKAGGWSQARYQRHVDNAHLLHAKEVIERLDAIVVSEGIEHVIVAGDEVIVPLIREQLPDRLKPKLVDIVRLDRRAPAHEILEATLEAMRRHDQATDEDAVNEVVDAWRAGGLGCVGLEATRTALENGQVDRLILSAVPERVKGGEPEASRLVTLAHQTAASVRFIERSELLEHAGGVGARLRFRI